MRVIPRDTEAGEMMSDVSVAEASLAGKPGKPAGGSRRLFVTTFLLFLGIAGTVIAFYNPSMRDAAYESASTMLRTVKDGTHGPPVKIEGDSDSCTVYLNVTFEDYDQPDSLEMLPWDFIFEPHKYQTIEVMGVTTSDGWEVDLTSDDVSVAWDIDGYAYSGVSTDIKLSPVRVWDSTVTVTIDDTTCTRSFTIANRYVRREIRTLTDDDRDDYFTALKTLYTTSQADGEALYGSKYRSAEMLLYKHLNGAGTTDCDHWHDGAGIITHHAAFTLEAEQSLQSINPKLSMPYWEYPMDGSEYTNYNWFESPIFQEDWYGTMPSEASDTEHIIESGTWAGVEMPSGSPYSDWDIKTSGKATGYGYGTLNPFVNGYGQMRTPWNQNPVDYISRSNYTYGKGIQASLGRPTCQTMSNCYASTTIADMNECMNGDTHGPVHIMIGGAWDPTEEDLSDGIKSLQSLTRVLLFKMLWRSGFTRCPTSCDDESTCACAVPDAYWDEYGSTYMLEQSGVLSIISSSISSEYYDDALEYLQQPGIAGEMFTSAAPYDPTFWPLHGSIERLVGRKRIMVYEGKATFDTTWGYDYDANPFYLKGICDWSNVTSNSDLTLPSCDLSSSLICPGHNEDDTLEWTDFIGDNETYTNIGMFDFLDPYNDDLPYTYDTFSFDYCKDYGYDGLAFYDA